MERITGPFAGALSRQRDSMNARFAAARAAAPFDAEAFSTHLATVVEPIVATVATAFAEKVDAVTSALFDVSIELFAANLLGPHAKAGWVSEVWQRLLPSLTVLVAREPARVAACISNAVVNLSATYGARPELWIARMMAVGPACASTQNFLDCGAVAAWQAGMTQYRTGALDAADRLPPQLTGLSFGLSPDVSSPQITQILAHLRDDLWLTPAQAARAVDSPRTLQIVKRVGAFRGFGGPFLRPPSVCCRNQDLIVSDGEAAWQLLADACGAVLIRTAEDPGKPGEANVQIDSRGRIRWGELTAVFPELAGVQMFAAAGQTLAVTLPTSHQILLLAKAPTTGGELRGGLLGAA